MVTNFGENGTVEYPAISSVLGEKAVRGTQSIQE